MTRLNIWTWILLFNGCVTAGAETLVWDPGQSGGQTPGGNGTWDTASASWWDGVTHRTWTDDPELSATFGGTPGTITLNGRRTADAVNVGEEQVLVIPQEDLTNRLTAHGDVTGAGTLHFQGNPLAGAARYEDTLMNTGLRLEGGAALTVDTDLTAENLQVSQILTVSGTGTTATFQGSWQGDGGNASPHLFLHEGGRFVLGGDAKLDFVNNAYFTRQLWIKGGGPEESDGVIEFAADFVADRTEGGTMEDGLGSIRLNQAVVITRHSQSIPVNMRPRPGNPDGPQTNGHFVFEHNPGMWIVRQNPQTYAGAMWFRTDAEIRTEVDITHIGVTEDDTDSSHHYRAGNAFQTNNENLTITKSGTAALILAGEQAYKPGTVLRVEAGKVRFASDPASGYFHNSINDPKDPAGPDLNLRVLTGAAADFTAPASEIASLEAEGDLHFELNGADAVKLRVHGNAQVEGRLVIRTSPGFTPEPGEQMSLIQADNLIYAPTEVVTDTGAGATVTRSGESVLLTWDPPGNRGSVILDEEFLHLADWKDLSTAVTWTSTPSATTVFQTTPDGAADSVLNLNDASRNVGMWGSSGIRSYSAIDHQFSEPIDHRHANLTVEFRMRWDKLDSNEGNRVGFTLIHDYPSGGLNLTPDTKVNDLSDHWWGRPAYQVRLRSKIAFDGVPIFLYGGGNDIEGEFEKSGDGEWLAGFSSAPGGTSPGSGSPYPDNGWTVGDFAPVSTNYQRYRYIVKPHVQELWVNEADDGETWTFVGDMPTPFEEDAPSEAPLYRYFEHLEGLRIYFRSPGTGSDASNVYLDYVRVRVEELPEETTFSTWAAAQPLPEGEDGPEDDPFDHGITNLERYALAYPVDEPPPPEQRPRLRMPEVDGDTVMYSFHRPLGGRQDTTYTLWFTGDLLAEEWSMIDAQTYWRKVPDGGNETVEVSLDGLDFTSAFVKLKVSLSAP